MLKWLDNSFGDFELWLFGFVSDFDIGASNLNL